MRHQRLQLTRNGRRLRALFGLAVLLALSGCFLRKSDLTFDEQLNHFQTVASQTQYPEVEVSIDSSITSDRPLTLDSPSRTAWYLTPERAVELALANSPVLRELGGQVLQQPYAAKTIHNPAIVATDPRFGVEAALSAFDAEFYGSFFAENNDYVANNRFLGGGTNQIVQDLNKLTLQVSKRAATGTEYYLRHNMDYDSNNAPGNLFPSAYNVNMEAEFRHPLMQGGGVEFNRIAGPGATPGNYNGVVIARLNADVSMLDFELAVRDLVNNVENAYWDLYFAYRDLEAKVTARDATRLIWEEAATRAGDSGRPDLEPQAREQFFRYKEEVQNALSGRVIDGTRSNNGSSGGTFRGWAGVQVAERRLRLLMGAPINDHQMIVPTHEPFAAEIIYDWEQISGEAVARRTELRRQRLLIKRRELELVASKNFLLPRFDAFGRYRYRGFGDDLLNPDSSGLPPFDNAWAELTSGQYQEWRVGAELRFPIGFRQAHSGVRNAQLLLARDKAVLIEQERQVIHDLSNSVSDIKRAYETLQAALNRRISAQKQIAVLNERKPLLNNDLWINAMLDAQQRLTDATVRYHAARVEYIVAVKNLHLEKGTLLEYNNIFLAENMPAVVGPSNGPEPPPGAEGPAPNGLETLGPGTVVPETTEPNLQGPGQGASATPQVPPTSPEATGSGTVRNDQNVPTPVASDLQGAREAADATDASAAMRARVVTEHPTDGRPPVQPGESNSLLNAPEAPQARIRDMWGPGAYADPSVGVPPESNSVYQPRYAAEGGATAVPAAPAGAGSGTNRLAPPTPTEIPAVPETRESLSLPPPPSDPVGNRPASTPRPAPTNQSTLNLPAPPTPPSPPTPPTVVPAQPINGGTFPDEVPAPNYSPGPDDARLRGAFGDPSIAVPPRTSQIRSAPTAPEFTTTRSNVRVDMSMAPTRSAPVAQSPANEESLSGLPSSGMPTNGMPSNGTPANGVSANPTPVREPSVSSDFASPVPPAPPTPTTIIAAPETALAPSLGSAPRAAMPATRPAATNSNEAPLPPEEFTTGSSPRRELLPSRSAYQDPSVVIPAAPRVTAPPISNRRTFDEAYPKGDSAMRRLPTTRRVVPASSQQPIDGASRDVNPAGYQSQSSAPRP